MRIPNIDALIEALAPISGSAAYKPAPPPGDSVPVMGQALMEPATVLGPRAGRTVMLPEVDDRVSASEGVPGIASRAGRLATGAVRSGADASADAGNMAVAGQAVSGRARYSELEDEADRGYRDALAKLQEAASEPQPTRPASPIGHKEAIGGLIAAGLLKAAGVPDRVIGDMARGFVGIRTAQAEAEFQRKTADFAANRSRLIAEAETRKGESEMAKNKLIRAQAQDEVRQKTATETINRLIGLASAGRTDPEVFQVAIHFAKANGVDFDDKYVTSLVKGMQDRRDTSSDIDRITKLMPQLFGQASKVRENPPSAMIAAGMILGMVRKYPDAFPTLFGLDPEAVESEMSSVLTIAKERQQQLELREKQITQTIAQGWARVGIQKAQADAMIAESNARQAKLFADTEKVLKGYVEGPKGASDAVKRINELMKDRDKAARALAGFEAEADALADIDEIARDKAVTNAARLRAEVAWIEDHIAELEQAAGIRTPSILKGPIGAGDGVPRARRTNPYASVTPSGTPGSAIEGTFNGKPFRLIPR